MPEAAMAKAVDQMAPARDAPSAAIVAKARYRLAAGRRARH
jgi:hypothetical protein